jgi:hypothetical protein
MGRLGKSYDSQNRFWKVDINYDKTKKKKKKKEEEEKGQIK